MGREEGRHFLRYRDVLQKHYRGNLAEQAEGDPSECQNSRRRHVPQSPCVIGSKGIHQIVDVTPHLSPEEKARWDSCLEKMAEMTNSVKPAAEPAKIAEMTNSDKLNLASVEAGA